jgi:uncharacterized SAM-binding protein YcdF (DUF218 family)
VWTTIRRILRTLCLAIGACYLAATVTPLVRWWALLLAGQWTNGECDRMVVLTGSSLGAAVLGESSYRRSVYAVLAERRHGYREIWISGAGGQEAPVARLMADFLVSHGVDRNKIRLETESETTQESGQKLAQLAGGGPVALVSSDYHMRRAVRVLRRAGIAVEPVPAPDALKRAEHWQYRWGAFLDLAAESGKLAYYAVRGWV